MARLVGNAGGRTRGAPGKPDLSQHGIVLNPDTLHTARISLCVAPNTRIFFPAFPATLSRLAILDDFFSQRPWNEEPASRTMASRSSPHPPEPGIVRDAHGGQAYAQLSRSQVMNTFNALSAAQVAHAARIAVACAAAFLAGFAYADPQPDQTPAAPTVSQDVGGTPMSTSASGGPTSITREQVYQDLVRSEQSGERAQLDKSLYHGQ
jgi:hypothetical protein